MHLGLRRVLFLLIVLGSAPVRAEETPPPAKFDLGAIDAYVAAEVRAKRHPGLALAIMKDSKIVFAKGYGKRCLEDSTRVEPETPFAVGSVTKQFTCACILLLAEDGKLALDDPVAKYEPELTRADDITLYDLMTHTSGYPDYYPLDFVDRRLREPIALDSLLARYARGPLDFEPGTRWSYSNTGFLILGRVVEKASGEPFGAFLTRRILRPLGMTHSTFDPDKLPEGAAKGYASFALGAPEPASREAKGWLHAAGGLWASAPDLARWDLALMDGRVLKPESFRRMTEPRRLRDGRIREYGCGLNLAHISGETVLTHGGAVSGFLADNAMVPRTRSAVIVLTNGEYVRPFALHTALLNLLVKDQAEDASRGVPKVRGPKPEDAALDFLHEMQAGRLDRTKLGEEFSAYLDEDRVRQAAPRLKALGEPESVVVTGLAERGGMEVASLVFRYKDKAIEGTMFRSTEGKIQQLLFHK
jgi:CubicO group peptidase (beta-lactamase class C family)